MEIILFLESHDSDVGCPHLFTDTHLFDFPFLCPLSFNPTAHRTSKTPKSFGRSECKRVKGNSYTVF